MIRQSVILNTHLHKFDSIQKSVLHHNRLSTFELVDANHHLYMLFFVKIGVILAIILAHKLVVKRMFK